MAAQAPTLVPRGAVLMTVLTEGSTPDNIATAAQLRSWVIRLGIPFTTTLDSVAPQQRVGAFFGLPRDSYVLVDLQTMTVAEVYRVNVMAALRDLTARLQ